MYCGSCVVLPQPVSPETTMTYSTKQDMLATNIAEQQQQQQSLLVPSKMSSLNADKYSARNDL